MNWIDRINSVPDSELLINQNLTSYTTFKLNSEGDLLKVKSIEALQKIMSILDEEKKKYLIIGWGANQILPAKCTDLVIHLEFIFDPNTLREFRDEYTLPSSLGLNHLTALAVKFGLKGWEVFTGIPASLGGAIYMNAGTNLGEIGSLIKTVTLVTKTGGIREVKIDRNSFSYRKNHFVHEGEIIVAATIKHYGTDSLIPQKIKDYLDYRKQTQPLSTKNCGCVFQNPLKALPAGKLIDLLQLKGVAIGELRISSKHGNFMENKGSASWRDFKSLVDLVNFEMDHFYGIEFELEVKISYN